MRGFTLQQLNWEQYQADFAALAAIGENAEGGVDRLAFTEADQQAHGLRVAGQGAQDLLAPSALGPRHR